MPHVDEALLVAYADDALSASERGDVEAHLVACVQCRARVDEERALAQRAAAVLGLGAPPVATTAPPFEEIVRRSGQAGTAAGQTVGRPRVARRTFPPLAWAALLIVALGAGWIARVLLFSPDFNAPVESVRRETADDAEAVPSAAAEAPAQEEATVDASTLQQEAVEPAPPPAPLAQRFEAPADADAASGAAAARAAPPAAAVLAAAPGTGIVTGRVVNADTDEPVAGGQVRVEGTSLGTLTDAAGEFVLRDVPPGAQTLNVAVIGFSEANRRVSVEADSSITTEVPLRPSALALEAVTVTGAAGGRGAVVIDAESAAWRGASLEEAAGRGARVPAIPGAAVEAVWLGAADAPWRARVVQRVEGAALEIIAWRSLAQDVAGASGTLEGGRSYLFTTGGGEPVLLRAMLPVERLRALAARLQPLP